MDGIVAKIKTMEAIDFNKKITVCFRERTFTFFLRTTNPAIAQTIGIVIAATTVAPQVFERQSEKSREEKRSGSS